MSDSDDDVMLRSAFWNSLPNAAILSLFLSDTEESDFSDLLAEED